MNLEEARKRLPELEGLSDPAAIDVIHEVYYPQMDRAKLAGKLGYKEPPPPPPERSNMRAAGDLALQFGGGAVSGVRMMTDLAGANNPVSGTLRSAEDALQKLQSAAAQADQQQISAIMKEAENLGFADQVLAGVKAFGVAPAAMVAQALGTSIPTLVTAAIPGAGPMAMAARVGAAGAMGAAQGAGNIKGVVYEQVKAQPLPGETPEQTEARAVAAQEYAGPNADQIAAGGALGAVAGSTGMERVVGALRNGVTKAAPGMAARVGMGAVTEAVPEIAQGGQEKFASNMALGREGFDVDPMSGVVAGGTLEGLAGGAMGGALGLPRPAVRDPATQAGDAIRAAEAVPEVGPMSRAANVATELKAQQAQADVAAQVSAIEAPAAPAGSLTGADPAAMVAPPANPLMDAARAGETDRKQEAQTDKAMARMERQAQRDLQSMRDYGTPDPFAEVPVSGGQPAAAPLPTDVLNPSGAPFKSKMAAQRAAKTQPGEVVPVAGGFAVRPAAPAEKPAGIDLDADWQTFPPETQSMGLPRAEMPQVKASHRGPLTNFLSARGVLHEAEEVAADTLKPTQAEFSLSKVQKARDFSDTDRSILVSGDGYVVDGHHQWLARGSKGENVKIIRFKAPIAELLPMVREFPSSTVDETTADVKNAQAPAAEPAAEAQTPPVEAPAPAGGDAAPAAGVPDAGGAGEAQAGGVKPTLQRDLAGAKPRYSYGPKQFDLTFDSDVDRAAYVIAQEKASSRDADYLKFVMDSTGMDEAGARAYGQRVKDSIKAQAKDAEPGALAVPAIKRDAPPKKPPYVSKEDGEHLFGVDKKRQAAIDRIAKGTAYFGTADKASEFITKNGLKDTHEHHQPKPGRFEVRAKGAAPAPLDSRGTAPAPGSRVYNEDGSYSTVPKEKAIDRRNRLKAEREQAAAPAPAQAPAVAPASDERPAGVVKVPPTVDTALTGQMQKQKNRVFRLEREASKNGMTLEEKSQAQLKVKAAETTLRKMRTTRFEAEDAAIKAVETGNIAEFGEHADIYPDAIKAIEDLIGGTAAPAAAPAVSANTIFTEDAAAAARALLKRKLGTLNSGIDPELLQAGLTLAGYHIEKGARTFAAYASSMVADLGEGVRPYLKSWYMGVKYDPRAGAFDGMDSAATVESADVDNLAESADTGAQDDGNAAQQLDRPSAGALAGAQAPDVRAPDEGRDAGAGPDRGGRSDSGSTARPDDTGGDAGGSLGSDAGAVPVPARGARADAPDAKKRRVPRAPRTDAGDGLFGAAGGLTPDTGANPAPNAPQIPAPQPSSLDFTITEDLALGEGGQKTKFKNNVAAIRLMRDLEATGRMATPDEQAVLAKYVGWGGLPQAFDARNPDWAKEHAEITELMSPEDLAAARQSTRYAHYTSKEIIQDGIYAALRHFGFTGGKTLEAGAGVGNFIGMMPADMRSAGRFTAIEREPFSSAIARQLYPQQSVQRADFTEFKGTDAYFDAAVGNPPFASDPQTDRSGRKHLSGLSLHNYFFAKAVDMLREGGILAQVVTNSFMDAKGDKARKYISDRTEFLGAIRLPNSAFAKNANTEVTTDIIFLKKRADSEVGSKAARDDAKRWLNTGVYTDARGKKVALNQYFIDNPGMMLGEFGAYGTMYGPEQPALVARPGQDTLAMLKEAVGRLPARVYKSIAETGTENAVNAAVVALKNPSVKEGGYFVEDGKLMQRLPDLAGEARGVEITPSTPWTAKTTLGESGFERIKALATMRGTVRGLLAAEMSDDAAGMKKLRAELNTQYDAYREAHGLINDTSTLRVFDDDPDFPLLASLEHGYTPGIGPVAAKRMGVKPSKSTAKKGPIFTQRVVAARTVVQKVDNPADALAVSMAERGRLDAAYIGQLLGMEPDEVLRELSTGEKPLLFRDPLTDEYVLRDAYLSGNVRAKLAQAKQAGMFTNINALEAVQPEDVPSHEIVARLGSPWVPTTVYADFARALYGEDSRASVFYLAANSSYQVSVSGAADVARTNTWGTPKYPGDLLLQAIMNNRPIKVTYTDSDGKSHADIPATEAANEKATEIKARFNDWIFSDPERSELLTKAYNETNNNYVTRVYDGSHMTFPGKVPDSIIKFRRHQRNAIARIVQDRTALLDHVVGAGKTFTVISGAMELKRTGLARKPMVAVPNHLVKQWAADFYRLYPGANVLTATKKDFEKANRRKFLARIATGDWDAVVIAHSSFGFIKPAPEFEAEFNGREIAKIMATITEVKDSDGDKQTKKRTVKQLEAMKERLENRIAALRDKPMDDLLDFEQIGVDQMFVDEAHMFKNLMYTTKMQGVAGLNEPTGSQRAYDMYVKTNQVMEKNGRGQGVVFATGTPVSNSLAEMYHMMRYLMPKQMSELGFESFDAWANTYASVEQVWMQAPSGDGFKAQNRMSNFVNTPELLKMFDQVSDTVTMDDIKKAYAEENDGAEFPLPKLKGGRRTPVSLEKSAAQNAYMDEIAKRAKAIELRKGPPQKGQDNILVVMSDARKAAMDIRLVDPDVTERAPGGRIDRATDEVLTRYKQYDSVKGTQIVFSDLGTPIKHAKKELAEYEALLARVNSATEDVTASAALGNEAALETIEDAEAAQAELDAMGPDWLSAVKAAMRGFSIYDDFRAALVEKGIPEAEIAFIHDYNTDDQKAALFRKVNAGQIRVLLGSTAKLGAGTNVQERLVAEHHLDVPWRPSDVEQREGRIERQGNRLMTEWPDFEIEILAYVTRDTLDMRMWQVQETKLKMINQLRTRKIGREIDNAFEDMELSAGEMQAAATGDINLLKEIQLRNDVKKLEQRRRSFDGQKNDLISRKRRNAEMLRDLPAKMEEASAEAKFVQQYRADVVANRPPFAMNIDGKDFTDAKEAQAVLREKDEATEEIKALNGEVATKKAPLSVTIDGELIKNRATMAELFSNARGDVDAIAWDYNGETYRRRTVLANGIRAKVLDAIADESVQQVGTIGAYSVAVEGSTGKYGAVLEVTMRRGGKVVLSNDIDVRDSGKAPERVVQVVENLMSSAASEADYLERSLARAKRESAELAKVDVAGEWPDQGKLDAARAAHKEILSKLKQKDAPAAADPEQPAAFSLGDGEPGAVSLRQAQEVVDGIRARWTNAPEIVVVDSLQESSVPRALRMKDIMQRSQGTAGQAEGVWYDGKAYIVASALKTPADVARVVFHEVLGHYGLQGTFGGDLTSILKQVAAMRRRDVEAKARQYGLDMSKEADRLQAAEEVLAEMAQATPELGFVRRAVAAVRAWLRKHLPRFAGMKLSDADIIAQYILPARQFVAQGRTAGQERLSIDEEGGSADTEVHGPATQAHRTAAAAVRDSLNDRRRASGGADVVLDAVAPGTGNRGRIAASVAAVAQRVFAREVVYVRFEGKALFNGMVSTRHPGKVFINIDSRSPFMAVLGHELLHEMAKSNPGVYADLSRRLDALIKGDNVYAERMRASYARQQLDSSGVDTREELEADIVGDNFMDPEFWAMMGKDQPDLFQRIAKAIVKWLDAVAAALGKQMPFDTAEYLSDVEAARAAVADAMRQFSSSEAGAVADPTQDRLSVAKADQTDAPAFRAWFKDSKVVDAKGQPLVVYHGTNQDFSEFRIGWNQFGEGEQNLGIFFGNAEQANTAAGATNGAGAGESYNVMPVYLQMRNPLRVKMDAKHWFSPERVMGAIESAGLDISGLRKLVRDHEAKGKVFVRDYPGTIESFEVENDTVAEVIRPWLESKGYDGVVYPNTVDGAADGSDSYIVFNPKQIKSAIGNRGDFDAGNDDIRFSLAAPLGNVREMALPSGYIVNDLFKTTGKLSWWNKTVGTMYNLAQRDRNFKPVFEKAQEFLNDVAYYAAEASNLAPKILPKLETLKDITKSPIAAEDNKAIAAPIFEGTLAWMRDPSTRKALTMEEAEAKAAALSTEDKAGELLRKNLIAPGVLKMWQGLPLDQYTAAIEGKYERELLQAGIVWTDAELRSQFKLTDGQIGLYREFRAAVDKSLTTLAISDMVRFGGQDVLPVREMAMESASVDDAAKVLRDFLLAEAEADPQRRDVLTDTADRMLDKAAKASSLMERGYAPLSRFGRYSLDVVDADGERVYFGLFESQAQANKMARQMRSNFPEATFSQGTVSQEAYKMFAGVSPETLELFGQLVGLEAQGDGAQNQVFQTYLKNAKSQRSAMKRLIQRKGIAGFSEDPGRVLAGFVYSNARQTSSSLHMGELATAVDEIPKTKGELKDMAVKLNDYVKNPQEEAQALRGLLFAQYLGGSVSSALLNAMQPVQVTFPWLSQYGGAVKAASRLKSAIADVLGKRTLEPALAKALKKAEEDGVVSPQEVFQLQAQAAGRAPLLAGDGTRLGDAGAAVNNTLSRVTLAWGKLFGAAEQFNRRSTFIAAYRTAVEQRMEDPARFAEKAVYETQFVYSKANRPQWARGAVGSTIFTFKQYSISYVELMHRMYTTGGPEGKRAALLGIAVLFLMSGMGGLPFNDDLEDLVDGFMQRVMNRNFSSKQAKREFFIGLLGRDAANFIERGVSGLPGAPIDVSGRLGLGNLIPGTGVFQKKDDYTRDVMEIIGPAGDLAKRGGQAAGKALQGEVLGARGALATISPVAARNAIKGWEMYATGMYLDDRGRKVIDSSGTDALFKSIGIQPAGVAQVQESVFEVQRQISLNKIREAEIANKWAMGVFRKDSDVVREARSELAEWNRDNPNTPIEIKMPQIIKRVRQMNLNKTDRIAKTAPKEIRNQVREELREARQ